MNHGLVYFDVMISDEEQFEWFIRRIVRPFLLKRRPSEQDIKNVFEKLKAKAETATRLEHLEIIGRYSEEAVSYVISPDKEDYAWEKHNEVSEAIKKRHGQLTTIRKGIKAKVSTPSGAGVEFGKSEERQPPS